MIPRRLVHTFFSFGAIQAAQYLLPLLAFPLLASRIGSEAFGILLYMLNASLIISIVIDWGFVYSGVREIAKKRNEPQSIRLIFSSVLGAKTILAVFSIVAALIAWPCIPYAFEYSYLYWPAIIYGVVLGWNPTWFYQGYGKGMRLMATLDVCSVSLALIATFLLVKSEDDASFYLLSLLCFRTIAYSLQIFLAFKLVEHFGLNLKYGWKMLLSSSALFISRLASMLYNQVNVVILGFVLSPEHLGLYIVADKLMRGVVSLSNPLTNTLFPEICAKLKENKNNAMHILRYSFLCTGAAMIVMAGISVCLAPWLMELFTGSKQPEAASALRVMSLTIPVLALNMVLGTQTLVPFGLERQLTVTLLSVGILNLGSISLLSSQFGLAGAQWNPFLVESSIFIVLLLIVKKHCRCKLI